MSDTKLRDLERLWKETGTIEDEAAYLIERVRVGNLNQERLELAAYCGHEAALLVSVPVPRPPRIIRNWIGGIPGHSSYRVRAVMFAARAVHPLWTGGDPAPGAALTAVEHWLDCPCSLHQEGARAAYVTADRIVRRADRNIITASFLGGMGPTLAALAVAKHGTSDHLERCRAAVQCAANALGGTYDARASGLRSVIASSLVDWALVRNGSST